MANITLIVIDEGRWRRDAVFTSAFIRMVTHDRLVRVRDGERSLSPSSNRSESLDNNYKWTSFSRCRVHTYNLET